MKKIEEVEAQGFLKELLSSIDERELACTRNRMLIASKISDSLRLKKISQKQFAEMMGKSTTVISEWLSGDRNFTVDTLTDISLALGIRLLDTTSLISYPISRELTFKSNEKHCVKVRTMVEATISDVTSHNQEKSKELAIA